MESFEFGSRVTVLYLITLAVVVEACEPACPPGGGLGGSPLRVDTTVAGDERWFRDRLGVEPVLFGHVSRVSYCSVSSCEFRNSKA